MFSVSINDWWNPAFVKVWKSKMVIKITSGTPSLCCSANANKTESKWNSFASDIFLFLPVFSPIRRNKDEIVAFVCKIWTHTDFCCHNRNFSTLVAERNTRLLASHTHIHIGTCEYRECHFDVSNYNGMKNRWRWHRHTLTVRVNELLWWQCALSIE